MVKVTPITEQFQHFVERDQGQLLGGCVGEDAASLEAVAGGGIAAATGPASVPGRV